jgi:nucleoside-diphosphate kinase
VSTTERTLVLVKPDGVRRGLAGEVLRRVEAKGYRLVALDLRTATRDLLEAHYAEHVGKPFYEGLLNYITSGPVVAFVLEGSNAVVAVRKTIGVTKSFEAEPGSIRGDFALEVGRNLVHASDGVETAQREVALWFSGAELTAWSRDTDRWIFE